MRLRIVTPMQILVDADVSELSAPGAAGAIGVLPQHVAFLGQLEAGVVRFVTAGKTKLVVVTGGYLEVFDDVATILADGAERADAIDKGEARAAVANAREKLSDPTASEAEISKTLAELRLAEARDTVAG